MSADNGIYILESKDGFRVIHAQAIENIYSDIPFGEGDIKLNPKGLKRYFGDAEVISTRDEVWDQARFLYEEHARYGCVEYGIQIITGWEDKEFPE